MDILNVIKNFNSDFGFATGTTWIANIILLAQESYKVSKYLFSGKLKKEM